jgi:hypothetical protein
VRATLFFANVLVEHVALWNENVMFLEHDVSLRKPRKHAYIYTEKLSTSQEELCSMDLVNPIYKYWQIYIGMRIEILSLSKYLSGSLHIKMAKRRWKWEEIHAPFVHRHFTVALVVRDPIRRDRRMKVREAEVGVGISNGFGSEWHLFI